MLVLTHQLGGAGFFAGWGRVRDGRSERCEFSRVGAASSPEWVRAALDLVRWRSVRFGRPNFFHFFIKFRSIFIYFHCIEYIGRRKEDRTQRGKRKRAQRVLKKSCFFNYPSQQKFCFPLGCTFQAYI